MNNGYTGGDADSNDAGAVAVDRILGPKTHYALVMRGYNAAQPGSVTIPNNGPWSRFSNSDTSESSGSIRHHGPFRIAFTSPGVRTWSPRDTFSRLADGASNQLFLAEKHYNVAPNTNQPAYAPQDYCSGTSAREDCTYLTTWHHDYQTNNHNWALGYSRTLAWARGFDNSAYIARPNEIPANSGTYRFGAVHVNICNCLVGDGSVRGMPATTSQELLVRLADVDDGLPVALP